jgi:hypothetical protein
VPWKALAWSLCALVCNLYHCWLQLHRLPENQAPALGVQVSGIINKPFKCVPQVLPIVCFDSMALQLGRLEQTLTH